ncbi:hypothetical protein FHX09_000453 [Rhizobium sp. BK538]|nr:hypothetical protein [Rhizobium sp. BK060]MBB4166638.1 hypothetical protein [Rhizobium sp. BK538]TCM67614.1 hypothetical protein EV291_13321 [Rhizobium sp. BK068]
MIRSSTCLPQVDLLPALTGKLDNRTSYTTPWDIISGSQAIAFLCWQSRRNSCDCNGKMGAQPEELWEAYSAVKSRQGAKPVYKICGGQRVEWSWLPSLKYLNPICPDQCDVTESCSRLVVRQTDLKILGRRFDPIQGEYLRYPELGRKVSPFRRSSAGRLSTPNLGYMHRTTVGSDREGAYVCTRFISIAHGST